MMDMHYERPFHGPFSRKIEKVLRYVRGPKMGAFALQVLDLLDEFIGENLPESFCNNYRDSLLPCARNDVKNSNYEWALDDISTIEYFADMLASERLREVGDGCFRVYLSPLEPNSFPETPSAKVTVLEDHKKNKYLLEGVELDPQLKEDGARILPKVSGGIQ